MLKATAHQRSSFAYGEGTAAVRRKPTRTEMVGLTCIDAFLESWLIFLPLRWLHRVPLACAAMERRPSAASRSAHQSLRASAQVALHSSCCIASGRFH